MKVVARRKEEGCIKDKSFYVGFFFVIVVFMVVADVRRNVFQYRYRVT